jgi:hypothetical protein
MLLFKTMFSVSQNSLSSQRKAVFSEHCSKTAKFFFTFFASFVPNKDGSTPNKLKNDVKTSENIIEILRMSPEGFQKVFIGLSRELNVENPCESH